MCSSVGIVPSLPRRCGRQTHRSNTPADTPSEYYCRTITIPFLDHLLVEMTHRFSKHQQTALLGLSIIPSIMISISSEQLHCKVQQLADLYEQDLSSPECLHSELLGWQLKWKKHSEENGEKSLPSSPTSTICQTSSMFPNVKTLLKILCTLPVTSCSAERSFSELKRIKTPFRSAMTNIRLSGLALLYIHRDININIPAAIDDFARRLNRRMQMVDILNDNDN